MHEEETPQQKAVRLLKRQLEELQTIRSLNYKDPGFKAWWDTTTRFMETFLGRESPHFKRFQGLRFSGPAYITPFRGRVPPPDYVSPEDAAYFKRSCETAEASLKAAISDIEEFGVDPGGAGQPSVSGRGRGRSGGVNQTFHGPVSIQNLAIAADNAIQKIEHMGDKTGATLKEIADLLQHSEELSPREVKEGLAHIEAVALEVRKPEKERNGKTILERCEGILSLANKATDLTTKLAPYTPAIFTLMDQAKHWIK